MVDMNEHVISSSQEVTYHNLDIVDCAVASTILDDTDTQGDNYAFQYSWHNGDFYQNTEYQENEDDIHDINCKFICE